MEMPHDMTAEVHIIAGLLVEPKYIENIAPMLRDPMAFWRTSHQIIYVAMLDLWTKDGHYDYGGLVGHIVAEGKAGDCGGREKLEHYLREIVEGLPSAYGIDRQAKIVAACFVKRKAIWEGQELINFAQSAQNSTDEVITKAYDTYNSVNKARGTVDKSTDAIDIVAEVIQEAKEGKLKGHPLGFRRLNTLLGGLVWGGLYYIGARPGKGKTALLMNIASHNFLNEETELREPVGVWTSEMSEKQIVGRLISSVSGVDGLKFKNGNMNNEETAMIEEGRDKMRHGATCRVDATESYNVHDLINVFRDWNRRYKIRIFFVDYVQNLKFPEGVTERHEMIRGASNALRSFALATNSIVVSAAQLNRKAEERKSPPLMSDLEGASALEQDASGIMMLHKANKGQYKDASAEYSIRLVKNRHGPVGYETFIYEKALLRFRERTTADGTAE